MIRKASLADLEQVLSVERAGFPSKDAYNRRQFRRILSPTAQGIVQVDEEAGELRGLIALRWRKGSRVGSVDDLVVRPEHRGKGIGRALLEAGAAWAIRRGLQTLSVEVRTTNVPARTLYESSGFTLHKLLKDYYGTRQHGVRLRKTLGRSWLRTRDAGKHGK